MANRLYPAPPPAGASDLASAITIAEAADPTGTVAALLRATESVFRRECDLVLAAAA